MKIILTDDVVGVGDIGETVSVRAGFARNFLIPRGYAIEAQSRNAGEIAHRMRQIEAKKRRLKVEAENRAKQLAAIKVELELRVGTGGKVFGSVSARDIAAKLTEQGFEIDRRRVLLTEPIRKIGEHPVSVKLHSDVTVPVSVNVLAAEATRAEEEQETAAARRAIEQRSATLQEELEEAGIEEGEE